MSPFPWTDVAVILALIALNGVFAMSELAIVSARKPRLQAMDKAGSKGARVAIMLSQDPGKFLSTVQVGITLIGIIAGAYSGASLGGPVGDRIHAAFGLELETSKTVGFTIVIALTTYASLIIGELVPKQFALRKPEPIAAIMARPMLWLSKAGAPLVWLLDTTSALIFRVLGMNRESKDHVTAEELHLVMIEATHAGVIEESERAIISGVVRLADRPVREVMTPRPEIDWIDVSSDQAAIRDYLIRTPHTRIPVADGSVDDILGVVQMRDIVSAVLSEEQIDLRSLMKPVEVVPDRIDAMDALVRLREAELPMAMVHDEYGHFEGIVTPSDLLSAIAGDFASDRDIGSDPALVERDDGSFLVSGGSTADVLGERFGMTLAEDRPYSTVAGHALWVLKRLPATGEVFHDQGWRFEIVDMDGRRIDKLLVSRVARKRTASASAKA